VQMKKKTTRSLFLLLIIFIMQRSLSCGSFDLCENTNDSYVDVGGIDSSYSSIPVEVSSIFIPRLRKMLFSRVNSLSPKVPFEEKDGTAVAKLILESMYTKGRVYHSMDHVFNIIENCAAGGQHNPILTLTTLFHDVIYYSVDKSFKKSQLEFFDGVLVFENDSNNNDSEKHVGQIQGQRRQLHLPMLLSPEAQEDPLVSMVMRLFDFETGVALPTSGTNEFLSAIIGVRVLSRWLSLPQLMQLTVGIEGTIPFRPETPDGQKPMDLLYNRLRRAVAATDLSEDWLTESIELAAIMANRDLCSFDTSDRNFFLDSNWSLIPEFRPAILDENCPLREYYDEFLAMEGKIKFLISSVPNIFQSFRNVPSDEEIAAKQARTRMNLNLADDYAQVRRLQLMILTEFVTIVGEDPDTIPGRPFLSMEISQSQLGSVKGDKGQDVVRELLFVGRRTSFAWDPSRCLLGAYLYDKLGKKGVDRAVEIGKNRAPGGILDHIPKEVVVAIAISLVDVLPNRAAEFSAITNKLGNHMTL